MPLMKALFERCGEPIPMKVDKRDYLFQKNPNTGEFVDIIESEPHVNYLLKTGNFALVEDEATEAKAGKTNSRATKAGSGKTEPTRVLAGE